ncbi:hypothetical protein VNO78_14093 [Psophocarpus tetragonolobus]|uniref:Uncharacterized protein n=1 Tax=Psophocarpus tetragonolobus TaxID=3891 RepID=A0AAN9XPW6_PSOTE
MSSRSGERKGSQQIERVITSSKEGENDYLKPELMIQPETVGEEIEECKTPTWISGNQITSMLKCPPAPRKKRQPSSAISSHKLRKSSGIDDHDQLSFFEEIKPEEIDLFFQSMYQYNKAHKRCKSV